LQQIIKDTDFWLPIIVAVIGSGVVSTILTLLAQRGRERADAGKLAAEAANEAVDILTNDVIAPLREQVADQRAQIEHLEAQQARYWTATSYIRSLCHWLDPAVTAMDPAYMSRHPKPRLPDELREQVAHDTTDDKETS
jgi:hypothetical protein